MSFAPAWARGIHGGADERPFFSESEAETGGESDGDDSEDGAPLHSCDAIALRFFQTVGVVTGAVAVLSAMTNGAILVLQPAEFKECALRLYTMVFSALVIAAEMDAKRLLVDMSVMDNWFCRGLFYVFVGISFVFSQIIWIVSAVFNVPIRWSRAVLERAFPEELVDIDGDGVADFRLPRHPCVYYSKALAGPLLLAMGLQLFFAGVFVALEPWTLWTGDRM